MTPWQIILVLATVLLADLVAHWIYAIIALRRFEQSPLFNVLAPPEEAVAPEIFSVETSDGVRLRGGIYFPTDGIPTSIVIFVPETGGTYATALNYVASLLDQGTAVVSFDFRNYGESEPDNRYQPGYWTTPFELRDLHRVIDFVLDQPQFAGLPLGLVGISRGANVSLAVAATRPEVQVVWSQGAFRLDQIVLRQTRRSMEYMVGKWTWLIPDWHVNLTLRLMFLLAERRIHASFIRLPSLLPRLSDRRVMFVSGDRDSYIPTEMTRDICLGAGHDPDDSLWIVRGAKHNLERVSQAKQYDQKLVEFFDQAFKNCRQSNSTAKKISQAAQIAS
ncbi:MAG: alpha/beta fold hydrolase [Planctomycetaceae bacterium]|nr:alpha/beta fold hydrolase [Planctomycetaceae bacterium]